MHWRNSILVVTSLFAALGVVVACSSAGSDPVAGSDAAVDARSSDDDVIDASVLEGNDADQADALTVDARVEDSPSEASVSDATVDADAADAFVVLKRITGHVDYNGPVVGADVQLLAPGADSATTDQNGDFTFFVPLGAQVIVKVTAPSLYPMIRGFVVGATNRVRNYYLAGPPEQTAASSLGLAFDTSKGIVEVDFRNATIGGYSVGLSGSGGTITPGFGIALDDKGVPQKSTSTLAGGDGSTLLLGDVAPGSASFTPSVPVDAGLQCQPCDGPTLPIEANTVTWFDFDCGNANCQ